MLGSRLRQARQSRRLSLQEVASRAKISVATLSRIERDKQGVDVTMFMTLSKILKTPAPVLIGTDGEDPARDSLALQIRQLATEERTALWKELSATVRESRSSRHRLRQLSYDVEELLAQLDFLKEEIKAVQKRLEKR